MISGLSHCAGLVLTDKQVARIKHVQFVALEPGKALVVLSATMAMWRTGSRMSRWISPASVFAEASNYLSANLTGLSFEEGAEAAQIRPGCGPARTR